MNTNQMKPSKQAGPSLKNDQQESESSFLPLDLLTINDRKSSCNDSELISGDKEYDTYSHAIKHHDSSCTRKSNHFQKKGKMIQKPEKQLEEAKKAHLNKKRRMVYLQNRVEELQREVQSLRRNQNYCLNCRQRLPGFYRERICELIQPEEPAPSVACDGELGRSHSKDSLEFEKVNFHSHMMQSQEMEQKMWIFLGTMLIAMGSKVMDFDGTMNTFKILKESVDRVRRQVQKGQTTLGIDFFCTKEQIHQPAPFIDGMNFDPFYNSKEENSHGHFSLEGIKLESVEEYELFYDFKYNFNIKYDALLTIMEYARDNCSLS